MGRRPLRPPAFALPLQHTPGGYSLSTVSDVCADKQLLDRLARIEGQVRGLRKMLEEGRACEDVLTQLLAARSSLEQAGLLILDRHLVDCIVPAGALDDSSLDRLREAVRMWGRHASHA